MKRTNVTEQCFDQTEPEDCNCRWLSSTCEPPGAFIDLVTEEVWNRVTLAPFKLDECAPTVDVNSIVVPFSSNTCPRCIGRILRVARVELAYKFPMTSYIPRNVSPPIAFEVAITTASKMLVRSPTFMHQKMSLLIKKSVLDKPVRFLCKKNVKDEATIKSMDRPRDKADVEVLWIRRGYSEKRRALKLMMTVAIFMPNSARESRPTKAGII